MRASRLAFLLLLYVTLDFSNPMMPGAVSFDPDDCVEAVRAGRLTTPADAVAAVPAPAPSRFEPVRRAVLPRAPVMSPAPPRERPAHAWRTPAPPPAPDRSDDH